MGFSFPNFIPGCLDNVSVFLTGYLSSPPPSVCFSFVSEFGQDLCLVISTSLLCCLSSLPQIPALLIYSLSREFSYSVTKVVYLCLWTSAPWEQFPFSGVLIRHCLCIWNIRENDSIYFKRLKLVKLLLKILSMRSLCHYADINLGDSKLEIVFSK